MISVEEVLEGGIDKGYRIPGFSAFKAILQTPGPILEIGGPTNSWIYPDKLGKKTYISNNDMHLSDPRLSLRADGTRLPFKDPLFSAVMAKNLPDITQVVIEEAFRVLEKGGLLIWGGASTVDLEIAESIGFRFREVFLFCPIFPKFTFQKPEGNEPINLAIRKSVNQVFPTDDHCYWIKRKLGGH